MIPNAQPKPEPIARTKRRNAREEAKLKRIIRDACVLRDGFCRLFSGTYVHGDTQHGPGLDYCGAKSTWAHLEDWRRFKTRGMEPEERHTTMGSCMLCDRHHHMYDVEKSITVTFLSERGADGPIVWERR